MQTLLLALYVGPDQMMPVASILATVMGFVMIFWNKVVGIVRRIFGGSKSTSDAISSETHNEQEPPK